MTTPEHHSVLDVGDTLCGELALKLKIELGKLEPGQILQVIARDPAAPQDLPAWCQLTGNPMLKTDHPNYFIQRKTD